MICTMTGGLDRAAGARLRLLVASSLAAESCGSSDFSCFTAGTARLRSVGVSRKKALSCGGTAASGLKLSTPMPRLPTSFLLQRSRTRTEEGGRPRSALSETLMRMLAFCAALRKSSAQAPPGCGLPQTCCATGHTGRHAPSAPPQATEALTKEVQAVLALAWCWSERLMK